jgi:hypothetical protein
MGVLSFFMSKLLHNYSPKLPSAGVLLSKGADI